MNNHKNLNELFTDIANSIRSKTKDTNSIKADDFPTAIDNIPAGGGTLIPKTITQNGTYNASADNADGYSQVTVDVSGGGGISSFTLEPNYYSNVLEGADVILADESYNRYWGTSGYGGILVPNITPTILRQIENRQKDVFISVYCSEYYTTHFEFFTNAGNDSLDFVYCMLSCGPGEYPYGESSYISYIDFSRVDGQFWVTTNNELFLPINFYYRPDIVKINVSIIDRASE